MKARLSLVVLVAALAGTLQAQSFSGSVRNTDNQPLAEMTVQAYSAAGFLAAQAVTDSAGRYILPVPAGSYRILAFDNSGNYAVSFYPNANSFETSQPINLSLGQSLNVDFRLQPGLHLTGTVFDASTSRALGGAVVAAYNFDGSRRSFTTSASSGTYTLIVPAGSYKVVAYHDAQPFVPEFFVEQPLFTAATAVTAPAANVNFTLERGSTIRGKVVERGTATPVAGIEIVAYDLLGTVRFRTEANPAGVFALVVPAGSYKIAAEDASGQFETTFFGDVTLIAAGATITTNGSAVHDIQINPSRVRPAAATITQWIAAAGSGPGANETTFKTDLWLQNPGTQPLTIKATFLRNGRDNSAATGVDVVVPASGQKSLADVVATLFGASGEFGGIRLEAPSSFVAASRTYNQPRNAALGTFGFSFSGQTLAASRSRTILPGLSAGALNRTNIGLLNPQPMSITVTIAVFSEEGSPLPSPGNVTLQPYEWRQVGITNVENAYAVLSSNDGSFFSYAAVIENRSGDGTIIPPYSE